MAGKRSNPVLFFLLISMISFSIAELQLQTLFLNDDDAASDLSKTAASIPNPQLDGGKFLSLDMIHIDDHPSFAANNVKLSRSEILKRRLKRDKIRVASLSIGVPQAQHPSSTTNGTVFSGFGSANYITSLGIGTPASNLSMILDTGSDVIWLQCLPCSQCYDQIDYIFNPNSSSTYQELTCGSKHCKLFNYTTTCNSENKCQYHVSYGDDSFTNGDFAIETLTLRGIRIPEITVAKIVGESFEA